MKYWGLQRAARTIEVTDLPWRCFDGSEAYHACQAKLSVRKPIAQEIEGAYYVPKRLPDVCGEDGCASRIGVDWTPNAAWRFQHAPADETGLEYNALGSTIDDRRLAFFDVFPPMKDDTIGVVHLYKDAISAWHRHQRQDDMFFCVAGAIKVGTVDPGGTVRWFVMDARNPRVLTVPRNHWHGYQCLTEQATLLIYCNNKYDGTDEERATLAELGVSWERQPR